MIEGFGYSLLHLRFTLIADCTGSWWHFRTFV